MNVYEQLAQVLTKVKKITVLTGAGISTASGLPDFRSRGGLYDNDLNLESILSESYFNMNPKLFWKYFKDIFRFDAIGQYEPNPGHQFLKELENMGKEVTIITQNVDGLHRKAGSTNVLEVHGALDTAKCPKCRQNYGMEHLLKEEIPRCEKDGYILKTDVVLFEGRVKHMEEAYTSTCETDAFLALGTSLNVFPVKELPSYIRNASHIAKVIINKEPTMSDGMFDIVIHEDIVLVFNQVKPYIAK
ncbi:NAD-dependent protein deacylase [Paenibacillus alkaliterrae]|uniref:NAD-dependent protein deacylase n=1 Tax=Paenibacillus alkaliterrae TaxID=320909 RepID=UPI001F3DA550|nr:NAD-dependent protein deacylase [Paenibacillus alkaliterrae]MCF2939444.1 NAD-dependent protein deacylase [Paenibacillus alkaliterrae]